MKLALVFVFQGMFAFQDLTKLRRIGKLEFLTKILSNKLLLITNNNFFNANFRFSSASDPKVQVPRLQSNYTRQIISLPPVRVKTH